MFFPINQTSFISQNAYTFLFPNNKKENLKTYNKKVKFKYVKRYIIFQESFRELWAKNFETMTQEYAALYN